MTIPKDAADLDFDERERLGWEHTYRSGAESIWATLPFVQSAIVAFGDISPGPVLELPCGGGRNTVPLARALPLVVGVDRSEAALALAASVLVRERLRNCVLVAGDIHSLPFLSDQFAGVFCADLLAHLRNPEKAIQELIRVTAPGGCLVMNVASDTDSTMVDPEMRQVGPLEFLYRDTVYFRYYDRSSLEEILVRSGLVAPAISRVSWTEAPHVEYRDYEHQHDSWLVQVTKPRRCE